MAPCIAATSCAHVGMHHASTLFIMTTETACLHCSPSPDRNLKNRTLNMAECLSPPQKRRKRCAQKSSDSTPKALWSGSMTPGKLSARAARELSEAFREEILPVEEPYRVDVDPRRQAPTPLAPSPAPKCDNLAEPVVHAAEEEFPRNRPDVIAKPQGPLFGIVSMPLPRPPACSPLSTWWQIGGPPALAKNDKPSPLRTRLDVLARKRDFIDRVRAEVDARSAAGRRLMDAFDALVQRQEHGS